MECQFLDFKKKNEIYDKIVNSNIEEKEQLVELVLNEIQRLESVIKDYEVSMNQIAKTIESKTFKTPTVK